MEIQCIAIIGPQNNLLFIKTFPASVAQPDAAAQQEADRDTRRKFHFLCHTACDVFDTAVASATVAAGSGYLGLLYSLEDLAIFGYRTNTRAKLLIVTLVYAFVSLIHSFLHSLIRSNILSFFHSLIRSNILLHSLSRVVSCCIFPPSLLSCYCRVCLLILPLPVHLGEWYIEILIVQVSDRIIKDADVVSVRFPAGSYLLQKFKQIHTAYVRHIANPFTKPNSLDYITSKKLDASITQIAKATIEGDA